MADASQLLAAGGTSTISHGKLEEPDHSSSNWYFAREDIERNSPSRKDGIDLKKEAYLRKSYCTFLQDLGMRLKVPQVTIATAIVFCHRFFLRHSHHKNDRYMIATVCMFLAGKVEETPKSLRDVILLSYEIRFKKDPAAVQRIKQKDVCEQQKELVLLGERLVLSTLGFDLNIHHPYKPLVAAIKKFKVAQNALAQVAWNFVNDGLRTSLCLQFKPHHIAAGAIFLAAKFLKVKLPSDENKVWWQEFEVTPRQLEEVSNQMLELYEQNREPPASRTSDPSASADVNHPVKASPFPRTTGEAQPSANRLLNLPRQSSPSSAPEKPVLQPDATLRGEDDGQVPMRHVSVSNQAKQVPGAMEAGKEHIHGAGSNGTRYVTKSTANGPVRRVDDAVRSIPTLAQVKQTSHVVEAGKEQVHGPVRRVDDAVRSVPTLAQVKQTSHVVEAGKEQVHGAVHDLQGPAPSRSTGNGIVMHDLALKYEKQDMDGKYDVKDFELRGSEVEEDKKFLGDAWMANRLAESGPIQKQGNFELQDEYVSTGTGQKRKELCEIPENMQVEGVVEKRAIGETKTKHGVDDSELKKNVPSFDELCSIKAALEKRRKFRGEGGDGRSVMVKTELTDEEELLERELEIGVEAAAEAERAKQDRREGRAKLLQTPENEGLELKRERMEDTEGGIKRKRPHEETYQPDRRRAKSYDRADSVDEQHEIVPGGLLDRTEEGELPITTGQDQVPSPRTDRRTQQSSSPLKRHEHGSRDLHGHRDNSYDAKHRHGHSRDYYHQHSHHQHQHRVDGEREHRHHKDRDRQEKEYKKARYDHGK